MTGSPGAAAAPPTLRRVQLRLVLLYLAVFAGMGIFVPFYPVWLAGRGFDEDAVGRIVAAGIWVRVVAGPMWGRYADRGARHRGTLIALAAMAVGAVGLLSVVENGFVWVLLGTVAFSACFSPLIPLSDGVVVLHGRVASRGARLDYGRIRLFGSLSFLITCALVGAAVERWSTGMVLPLLGVAMGLSAIAALAVPRPPAVAAAYVRDPAEESDRPVRLWRRLDLWLLCGVVLMVQGSHGAYYAFAIRHWGQYGVGEGAASLLVAEGVVAEIVLFALAARFTWRPTTLLLWAAFAGVLRWNALAMPPTLGLLAGVQWLHALTFGLTHLAAIQWVARYVPSGATATAQTLLAAAGNGVGVALATEWAGRAIAGHGAGYAFQGMAWLAGCGGVAALALRLWTVRRPGSGRGASQA